LLSAAAAAAAATLFLCCCCCCCRQVLTCQPLPEAEAEFFELLNLYFPNVFDMK
jgi:hypothetical protein